MNNETKRTESDGSDLNDLFSRFLIRANFKRSGSAVIAEGVIFPNMKIIVNSQHSDVTTVYNNLESFYTEYNEMLGYQITFLDKAIPNNLMVS